MPDKSTSSFISFDAVDFCPSISKELLKQALTFALQYDEITENDKHTLFGQRNPSFSKETQPGARRHQTLSLT